MTKTATWRNTPFAKPFYKSRAWSDVRSLVMDRAHGLCERCAEKGELKPAEVVHHVKPLTERNVGDPEISLNPDNLMALCHDCHTEVHQSLGVGAMNGPRKEEPRVRFDSEGNVIPLEKPKFPGWEPESPQDALDEIRHLDEYLEGKMLIPAFVHEKLAEHGLKIEEGNVMPL